GGQPERVIMLGPPLKLAGRLVGALDRLPESGRKGKAERYLGYYSWLSDHVSGSGSARVDAEGRFEITGLSIGERVTVNVAGRSQEFVMKNSIANLELKIAEPAVGEQFPK